MESEHLLYATKKDVSMCLMILRGYRQVKDMEYLDQREIHTHNDRVYCNSVTALRLLGMYNLSSHICLPLYIISPEQWLMVDVLDVSSFSVGMRSRKWP